MEILLTPDVLSYLGFSFCTLKNDNEFLYFSLLAFSNSHIAFITPLSPPSFKDPLIGEIQTPNDSILLDLLFDSVLTTSTKHWIIRFAYILKKINPTTKKKWDSLLTINKFQQVRKDERIAISKESLLLLKLKSAEIDVFISGLKKTCVLRDLSFSGAHFFSMDDFDIDCDNKIIISFSFINPSDLATLRAVVVRKVAVKIGAIDCLDIAVRFLEPLDLVYLNRLTWYFQLALPEANYSS